MRQIIGYMLIGMGLTYIITLIVRLIKYIIKNDGSFLYKTTFMIIGIILVAILMAASTLFGWIIMKFIA